MTNNAKPEIQVGSVFSGIGGLELGIEQALSSLGFRVSLLWQAETDAYARAVLHAHWPTAHQYQNIKNVDARTPRVKLICGGFPCQDLSIAGKRGGLHGARSSLWFEFVRVIRVLRPQVVFVENVPELAAYLGEVLGPLAECGYDAKWDVFSASAVGAPHQRRRMFVLAHARGERITNAFESLKFTERSHSSGAGDDGSEKFVANTDSDRREVWWSAEPNVDRVVDGISTRLDARRRRSRIRCLGNSAVPQQAEFAFRTLATQ